jgi:hypothetical protein
VKKIGYTFATLALAGGAALAGAAPASAAHCVDSENTTPGYSYFGQEVSSGEREAKTTRGTSGCPETDPAPQQRAPGKNR